MGSRSVTRHHGPLGDRRCGRVRLRQPLHNKTRVLGRDQVPLPGRRTDVFLLVRESPEGIEVDAAFDRYNNDELSDS